METMLHNATAFRGNGRCEAGQEARAG